MPQRRHRDSNPRANPTHRTAGRHELGQNWLVDRRFPAEIAGILRHAPPHPVLELGAGNGAITRALVAHELPVTAVELDARRVARLRRMFAGRADVIHGDMLTFDFGPRAHNVVSNVPFSITTPVLRRLLPQAHWHTAVLLVQWEVARKRAAVGGTTMLTAMWWPWYTFALGSRVPATSFAPAPTVDGGILVIRRRDLPLVSASERVGYQRMVRQTFTGPGRGLIGLLRNQLPERVVRQWLSYEGLDGRILPRHLTAEHWASLFHWRHDMERPKKSGSTTRDPHVDRRGDRPQDS